MVTGVPAGGRSLRSDGSQPWSQGPYVRWLPDSMRETFGVDPLAAQAERLGVMNAPGSR